MTTNPRTYVYIDGFNLYYRAVRKTPYKWLDIGALCGRLLARNDILKIKYFTALADGKGDPDRPNRQQLFIRALRTLPNLEVIFGQFTSHDCWMPLAKPKPGEKRFVEVVRTEEKGSDVNIAAHLIHDAHVGKYDVGVLVSNDSDLAEPLRIVRDEIGLRTGVIYPAVSGYPSRSLVKYATFVKQVRKGVLKDSQFPDQITDAIGTFHKPPKW